MMIKKLTLFAILLLHTASFASAAKISSAVKVLSSQATKTATTSTLLSVSTKKSIGFVSTQQALRQVVKNPPGYPSSTLNAAINDRLEQKIREMQQVAALEKRELLDEYRRLRGTGFKVWPESRDIHLLFVGFGYSDRHASMFADPHMAPGSYAGLSQLRKVASQDERIRAIQPLWVPITKGTSHTYSGVHHIVNKATLKMIVKQSPGLAGMTRVDFHRGSPSIITPVHGIKLASMLIHDANKQFALYNRYGIKYVVIAELININGLYKALGYSPLTSFFMDETLLNAKKWCEENRLVWER